MKAMSEREKEKMGEFWNPGKISLFQGKNMYPYLAYSKILTIVIKIIALFQNPLDIG